MGPSIILLKEQHIHDNLGHLEVGLSMKEPDDLSLQDVEAVIEAKAIF